MRYSVSMMVRALPLVALGLGLAGCAAGASVTPEDDGYKAMAAGDYSKARDIFAPEQAKSPNDPYLQLDLGMAYQGLGRMDLAEPLYRQAMVSGKDTIPIATTNPADAGKSVGTIACENLRMGLNSPAAC